MSRVVLVAALAACAPEVNVGADYTSFNEVTDCQLVTAPATTCPEGSWGAPVALTTVESLEQRLTGRWAFCGGELRYSGRGPLRGLAYGAGVEYVYTMVHGAAPTKLPEYVVPSSVPHK